VSSRSSLVPAETGKISLNPFKSARAARALRSEGHKDPRIEERAKEERRRPRAPVTAWERKDGVAWETWQIRQIQIQKIPRSTRLPLRDTLSRVSFPLGTPGPAQTVRSPFHLGTCRRWRSSRALCVLHVGVSSSHAMASPTEHVARSRDIVTCLRCKAPNCIVVVAVVVAVHVPTTPPRDASASHPPSFRTKLPQLLTPLTYDDDDDDDDDDDNNIRHAPTIPSLFELTALSCSFPVPFSFPFSFLFPSSPSCGVPNGTFGRWGRKNAIGGPENVRLRFP